MSDIAIRVQNLSKRYRIGLKEEMHDTFAAALTDWMTRPIRNLRRLRRLTRFDDDGNVNRSNVPTSNASDIIWALKDVSFEVNRGEVVGIIGRNGAGKSTLLKILSHITYPTSGRVELHGRVSSLLEVGTGFHPELTGHDNIYLNGTILGMTKAEIDKKFDEIVDFSGVEKFIDTPVKRYSSGMRVRLAFSVAAHLEPEILLIDEVLAVGDAAFQKKCLGKMGEVAREGRTVLFVSHNMTAVLNLCPTALLLDKGRITFYRETNYVVNYYLNQNNKLRSETILPEERVSLSNDFRFLAVRVYSLDGQLKSQVLLSEGFVLEIEFEVLSPLRGSSISFRLWNNKGVCVFVSTDMDQEPERINSVRFPGRYLTRCHVPGEYLRSGLYQIDIASSIPRDRVLDSVQDIISVEVIDDATSVDSRTSHGRMGVIAPSLRWTMQKLQAC